MKFRFDSVVDFQDAAEFIDGFAQALGVRPACVAAKMRTLAMRRRHRIRNMHFPQVDCQVYKRGGKANHVESFAQGVAMLEKIAKCRLPEAGVAP